MGWERAKQEDVLQMFKKFKKNWFVQVDLLNCSIDDKLKKNNRFGYGTRN